MSQNFTNYQILTKGINGGCNLERKVKVEKSKM